MHPMKKCNKCKKSLNYSKFARNRSKSDGYENYCKSCKNKYNQSKYGNKYTKLYHKKEGFGIYKIENEKTGEIYIGKGWLNERKVDHFAKLKAQKHSNPYLQKSYNETGHESLKFSIIEKCDIELGSYKERHYIIEEYLKNNKKLLNQHVILKWEN